MVFCPRPALHDLLPPWPWLSLLFCPAENIFAQINNIKKPLLTVNQQRPLKAHLENHFFLCKKTSNPNPSRRFIVSLLRLKLPLMVTMFVSFTF